LLATLALLPSSSVIIHVFGANGAAMESRATHSQQISTQAVTDPCRKRIAGVEYGALKP
jgi:hypothetical protein